MGLRYFKQANHSYNSSQEERTASNPLARISGEEQPFTGIVVPDKRKLGNDKGTVSDCLHTILAWRTGDLFRLGRRARSGTGLAVGAQPSDTARAFLTCLYR